MLVGHATVQNSQKFIKLDTKLVNFIICKSIKLIKKHKEEDHYIMELYPF